MGLLACVAIGFLLKRFGIFETQSSRTINNLIVFVALPALIIEQTHATPLGPEILYLAAMPWLILLAAIPTFIGLGRLFGWNRATTGALILTGGFSNTSFIGFPVIEWLYGKSGLQLAVLVDQAGSFLAVSSIGIILATLYSSDEITPKKIATRIFQFPPLYALIIGLLTRSITYPEPLHSFLFKLGGLLGPLALISVGLMLDFSAEFIRAELQPLLFGLGYKLLVCPLLIFLIYWFLLGQSGLVLKVSITEAAMAPMITAGIIASQAGLNPRLIALMISIGTILSFLSISTWFYLLKGF